MTYLKTFGHDVESFKETLKSWRDDIYSVTDVLSNFAGNIKDAPGVFKVAKHLKPTNIGMIDHILDELKGK
ncbi:hypothetical protein LWT87_26220, partial [Enterobacter hormaechei]|nr:hypothetical protein [Enterobacter hormaechei]